MKIVRARPPVYEAILAAGLKPDDTTVFTYGETVYSPGIGTPSQDVLVHEAVHMEQHAEWAPDDADPTVGSELWWAVYLRDAKFRLEQELEAYSVQYRYLVETVKDRNRLARAARILANNMAGPLYGGIISPMDAFKAIRS